jgi:hypothetical protein
MTDVRRLIPIFTGRHRYDASLSLRGRPSGTVIEAPILEGIAIPGSGHAQPRASSVT